MSDVHDIQIVRTEEGERAASITLSESERHRLLADDRRRRVLDVLGASRGSFTVEALAREICQREAERDGPDADDHEAVLVTLHHVHLPMLDDAGVIEYDRTTRMVEPAVR